MDFILKLKEERKALAADLDPRYILSSLVKSGAITPEEYEKINSEPNRTNRFDELFEILTNGSKVFSQFKLFVEALEERDEEECLPYPWLAEKLKPDLKLDDDVHKILVRGRVPLPNNHLIPREDKIKKIRNKLKVASCSESQKKWVVLHGPIGSGKSSLAAEALRVNDLIKNNFSDGVFWLDFGGNKKIDTDKLEIEKKIMSILKVLNSNYKYSPDDDLTYLLQNEIATNLKVLIILDEVCDKNIIKAFNVNCPILVTTTLQNILEDVSSSCDFIECLNDLEDKDIKLLLSKYANCKTEELPHVVGDICIKCRGSLLVASLIGASMSDVGNHEKTWENWNQTLEAKGLAVVKKIEEEDVLNVIIKCIEHIKEWKEYFFDLVIIKKGFSVSSEVLEIMWNKNKENFPTAFFIVLQLYKRSFVVIQESESGSKFTLKNHDLYVDVICKFLGEEKTKELHKKFVDKVIELGKTPNGSFDFTKLPNDYIPSSLDYHLHQAGKFNVLEELYLDLKFIEQKICLMGEIGTICGDYLSYENCFQNKKDSENFRLFLKRSGDNILKGNCDIIQLALFEPNDSIVYKKAKEYADENKGLYYDWCNKIENILNIHHKIHPQSNAKFGAINQDASLIASVDGFESDCNSWLKIYHLPTGEPFKEINFHGDVINYCAFSSKGDFLATSSDARVPDARASDNTKKYFVKIFEIRESFPAKSLQKDELRNLFITFTKHEDTVICCTFSFDDEFVISSDISGITYVWKFVKWDRHRKPTVFHTFKHLDFEKDPFRFSSLSNKGDIIGTAAYDTLKLWDLNTEKVKKTFSYKNKVIKKFIFTEGDSRILLVFDKTILFWNVENNDEELVYSDDSCAIYSSCISTSGKYIACGLVSSKIIIIDVETGDRKVLPGHNDKVLNVMFSKNETKLFSISPNQFISYNVSGFDNNIINANLSVFMCTEPVIASQISSYSLEIRKGKEVKKLNLKDEKISAFALSNDGSEVVIGTENGTVEVFNVTDKSSIELRTKHALKITYILHSKNNCSFFTCSGDGTINIWQKKVHLKTLSGHTQPVVMCAEFKTCNKLLSCCKDGSLMVWNTDSGESIYTLKGQPKRNITCCDISCDDKLLTAAFDNGNIMIWEAESGKLLKIIDNLFEQCTFVTSCQISNDTPVLVAGLNNGNILLYHLYDSSFDVCDSKHDSTISTIKISKDAPKGKSLFLSASKSISLWNSDGYLQQTIFFPNSSLADEYSKIYTSEYFEILVIAVNSVLYILRRID